MVRLAIATPYHRDIVLREQAVRCTQYPPLRSRGQRLANQLGEPLLLRRILIFCTEYMFVGSRPYYTGGR